MSIESFESRIALAANAMVGIDFDQSGGNSPSGFVLMSASRDNTFTDIANLNAEQTQVDVAINLPSYNSFRVSSSPLNSAQVPSFDPALNSLDGFYVFESATSTGPFEIRVSDLQAGQDYEVYLVAVSRFNTVADQTVTITGESTLQFDQVLSNSQVFVNDELGSSSRAFDSFAEVITADSNGEILVSIETTSATSVAGFAIESVDTVAPAAGTISGRVFSDDNNDQILGLVEPGFVGETVFLDTNGNGVLDAGEVSTTTIADDPLTTDVDEAGSYSFTGLSDGQYEVRVIPPSGVEVTSPATGSTDIVLTAAAGKVAHFGLQPFAGVIEGFVWHDLDANGIFHPGEIGIGGRTVFLDLNDDGDLDVGEPSRVTTFDDPQTAENELGAYRFDTLPSGDYAVRQLINEGDRSTAPQDAADVFNLELNLGGGLTESQREIFYDAAAKWESVIIGDLPAAGAVDDIVISASAAPIDGPSGVLGSAGPRSLRSGSSLPAGGVMTFDTADLASLESSGGLADVVLHEMGHALGFTSNVWSNLGLVDGLGGAAPTFSGPSAVAEYNLLFGLSSTTVPVENNGGSGTAGSHWEESVFDEELMTGFYDSGRTNPLSRVSVGAFQDMGYVVDFRGADPFNPGAASGFIGPLSADAQQVAEGRFVTDEIEDVADPFSSQKDDAAAKGSPAARVTTESDVYRVSLTPGETVFQIRFGVTSVESDFGDAPSSYPTRFADDGARHTVGGPQLGSNRDADLDGQPSPAADGDGLDDDGVTFGTISTDIATAEVSIDLRNVASAKVDAWIDFNRDGDWDDVGEKILNSADLAEGAQTLVYDVPAGTEIGETFARVRASSAGNLAASGPADDGEVEDYRVVIVSSDSTSPIVSAFNRDTPATSPTNADVLVFSVVFNEAVQNVDSTDFLVTGTTGAISVVEVSSMIYNVTVSGGDLASLDGTVGLDLSTSVTISDLAGNALNEAEPAVDETYLVDNTAPTTVSFTREAPVSEFTDADTLVFLATFSESVEGVDAANFGAEGTTGVVSVSVVSPDVYSITVSGGDLAELDGTVGLNLAATTTISDAAGNLLLNTEPGTDETFLVINSSQLADFGDAPNSYPVTLAQNGARHASPEPQWTQLGGDLVGEAANDLAGRGISMSADGLTVVVGTSQNDGNGGASGHARVYRLNPVTNIWTQLGADIDGEGAGDEAGNSVALSADGDILAIGAYRNDGSAFNGGHARIFEFNEANNVWDQLGGDIDGTFSFAELGVSISLSADGHTVAVGGSGGGNPSSRFGFTEVHRFDTGTQQWVQLGSTVGGEARGDRSGQAISLSGDGSILALGEFFHDGPAVDSGRIRVFEFNDSTSAWERLGTDILGDNANDQFGLPVSISDDGMTVAGAARLSDPSGNDAGNVRIFRFDESSSDWVQKGSDVNGFGAGDNFGLGMGLSSDGNAFVAGASLNDEGAANTGQARVYRYGESSNEWDRVGLSLNGLSSTDFFGQAVAIDADGSTVIVSSRGSDVGGTDSGNAQVFRLADDLRLGQLKDIEPDGIPSENANAEGPEDDGVTLGTLVPGQAVSANVTIQGNTGKIDGWVDFNGDGDWDDEGEQVFQSEDVAAGLNALSFDVPANALLGNTYARFRLSSEGNLATTGAATDGEVEDYLVTVTAPVGAQVETVQVNDGSDQRSRVTSLTVTFDGEVTATPAAFSVINRGDNSAVGTTTVLSNVGGKTVASITFNSGLNVDNRPTGNSLVDGNFELVIDASQIAELNSEYRFGDVEADRFFSLFGDTDGDRDVDGQDYGRFGLSFLKSVGELGFNPDLDFDGDGDVDGQDYGQFGLRFLTQLDF